MASQPSLSDLRRATYARRLPAALSELAGPERGTVSLPLHLAWSGLTTFDELAHRGHWTARPPASATGYEPPTASAHGLVDRLSQDLDVATENPDP
ncbi:hypothetical protein ABZ326_19170 [Streptomyces californicus]|uniref:hypothetical protein n=1 Tax=Streptomyces californicus TaxID=67351 RepID=UPI0034D975B5